MYLFWELKPTLILYKLRAINTFKIHLKCLLKWIVHQFWIYNIFLVNHERNIFYKRSTSIKQLWLEIIEKIGCSKSVQPSTVIYIIYKVRTDFEHHFLNYIESELFYWDEPFTKNVSFGGARKKCYIFKLVNNPFNKINELCFWI